MQVPANRPRGYALVMALLLVFVASLGVALAVQRDSSVQRRERERQLLFAGDQIRAAIRSYHRMVPPGGAPEYPKRLEDLLQDRRFPIMVRHLRRLYPDPMTGKADWVLLSAGGIVGVRSRSREATQKHASFAADDAAFAVADRYDQWTFSAVPGRVAPDTGLGGDALASSSTWLTSGPGNAPDPAAPAPGSPGDPGISLTDDAAKHRAWCYQKYILVDNGCDQTPPPYGKEQTGCERHFQSLFEQCVASPAGP